MRTEDIMLSQNTEIHLLSDAASYARKMEPSATMPEKPCNLIN